MVEYLVKFKPHKCFFEKHPLVPKDGKIELPADPGFAIVPDEAKIEQKKQLSWS